MIVSAGGGIRPCTLAEEAVGVVSCERVDAVAIGNSEASTADRADGTTATGETARAIAPRY